MAAAPVKVVKVGNLDIQFSAGFDQAKANQLVQTLQQVIAAVNNNAQAIQQGSTTPVTPTVYLLATDEGLGPYITVEALQSGQVLVATGAQTAAFGFLEFAQMAGVDAATFAEPTQGSVIAFIDGYWTAASNALGVPNPGATALLFWDETLNAGAGGLAWVIPGTGIQIGAGTISVNTSQLIHGQLLGLLADDHPQYALVIGTPGLDLANEFTVVQTFDAGISVGGDIDASGNIVQVGAEDMDILQWNAADDQIDEGVWRVHLEDGQEMWASVGDPNSDGTQGADGENWWYAQRLAEIVDTVGVQANFFRFNGFDVMCADPVALASPYLPVLVGGHWYNLTIAAPAAGVPGSGTVTSVSLAPTASSSLTVTGASPVTSAGGWTIQLSGDSASPGANMGYQTDGSGAKGWYALGAGSGTVTSVGLTVNATYLQQTGATSPITGAGTYALDLSTAAKAALTAATTALQPMTGLAGAYTSVNLTLDSNGQITAVSNGTPGGATVSDGTTTLTAVTTFDFSGAVVTAGGTGIAVVTITPSTPAPLTVPDCGFWFDAGGINITTGTALPYLANEVPWLPEPIGTATTLPGGATVSLAALNGLAALSFSGSLPQAYTLPANSLAAAGAVTVFVVANNTFSGNQAFCSGASGGFEFRTDGGKMQILAATVLAIAASSPLPAGAIGAFAIFTVSFDGTNFVFRAQRTAVGSGTSSQAVGPVSSIGYNQANGGDVLAGEMASILVYNRALTVAEMETVENFLAARFALNFTASYDAAVLADAPVVYYKLADTTGTTAVDSGPNSLNGTYSGSAFALAQPKLAFGINPCSEMGISGSNGYVDVPANALFAFTSGSYSAEFWMVQQLLGGNQEPVTTGNSAFRMLITGGQLVIIIQGSNALLSTTAFQANTLYHVAFTYDASSTTGTLYVNGVVDQTATITNSPTSPGDLYIGNLSGIPVHQYSGYISNVSLYAAALSLTRVQAHYAAGLAA